MAPRSLSSRLPFLLVVPFLLSLVPALPAQDTAHKTVSQPQVTAPLIKPGAKSKDAAAA